MRGGGYPQVIARLPIRLQASADRPAIVCVCAKPYVDHQRAVALSRTPKPRIPPSEGEGHRTLCRVGLSKLSLVDRERFVVESRVHFEEDQRSSGEPKSGREKDQTHHGAGRSADVRWTIP
jgi:hypothetical protein